MRGRADLPTAGIHFRAAIAEGFGVARGDEGRERTPHSGFSEKRTAFEIAGLADAVEDEANVMAAVAQTLFSLRSAKQAASSNSKGAQIVMCVIASRGPLASQKMWAWR